MKEKREPPLPVPRALMLLLALAASPDGRPSGVAASHWQVLCPGTPSTGNARPLDDCPLTGGGGAS